MAEETQTHEAVLTAGIEACRTLVSDLLDSYDFRSGSSERETDLKSYPIEHDTIEVSILAPDIPALAARKRGDAVGTIKLIRVNTDTTLLQVIDGISVPLFLRELTKTEPRREPVYVAKIWEALVERFRALGVVNDTRQA